MVAKLKVNYFIMISSRFDLSGRTALITGGAGLLGQEHALALLECNCNIVLTDISLENLEKAKKRISAHKFNSKISYFLMDVTSEISIIKLSEKLISKNIKINILINNAALDPKVEKNSFYINNSRLENFNLLQWDKEISIGLTGAFLCSKVFGTLMAEKLNGGCIVNIASDLSIIAPDHRIYNKKGIEDKEQPVKPITYSVIKSGLIGLTKYLSTYWYKNNVRCNALSPGGIFNNQDEEFVKRISERIPLSRMASKNEYREAIQFLCSEASSYLNGHNLVIDGGRSVW